MSKWQNISHIEVIVAQVGKIFATSKIAISETLNIDARFPKHNCPGVNKVSQIAKIAQFGYTEIQE